MDKQPEALRLAELEAMHERGTIRRGHIDEMLTELRRMYALNQELLEALCCVRDMVGHPDNLAFIDAVLAKAKEQT